MKSGESQQNNGDIVGIIGCKSLVPSSTISSSSKKRVVKIKHKEKEKRMEFTKR